MKKNNVSIDLISFGSDAASAVDLSIPSLGASSSAAPAAPETNETKLLALHEAVNSSDNSHYLAVEPGPHLLSEKISASAILRGEGAGDDDGMGGGGGGGGNEFGIDENLDPELAMALRMSLEEERARQAASNPAPAAAPALETVAETSSASTNAAEAPSTPAPAVVKTEVDDTAAVLAAAAASGGIEDVGMEGEADEDDDLARALALSRGDDVEMGDAQGDDGDDEDAEIARASEFAPRCRSFSSPKLIFSTSQSLSRCRRLKMRRRIASEVGNVQLWRNTRVLLPSLSSAEVRREVS